MRLSALSFEGFRKASITMRNHLSRLLGYFIHRSSQSSKLRKRDRLRKYLFESLESRNLLATLTVTSLADDVNSADDATVFTLREAINAANASVADDTIQFASAFTAGGIPVAIQMTGATFQLNAVSTAGITTINGPGADLLSISGNGTNNGRLFFVNVNASVVIRGLTMRNGRAFDNVNALSGGAVSNDGALTIEDCTFDNNGAGLDGGAVRNCNGGTLQIFGTTFTNNSADREGGALAALGGIATVVNSTFSGNSAKTSGGAITAQSNTGTTTVIQSTIVSNKARSADGTTGEGGGVGGNGFITLQNTIVAGNKRRTTSPVDDDITTLAIVTGTSSGNLIGNAATAGGLVHNTLGNILGNNGSGVLPLSSILDTTLRNNGGRTLTHALLSNSPAIDKGSFAYVGTGANVDQRGQLRPRDYPGITNSGDGRDIGALELREVIDLANLSSDGVTIFGADGGVSPALGDFSGRLVHNAGDVNGFDDLVIGAYLADASGNAKLGAGDSYLIFGKADWSTTPTIDLANLGTAGITIFGVDPSDYSGCSVSSAGDINGDGFDDLVIGAKYASGAGNLKLRTGESYVIFGKADWSATPTINLANLGSAGITIFGAESLDFSGISVSSAGDINGDGLDDLIIGATGGDALNNSKPGAGESYVIFGKVDWSSTPTIDLNSLGSAGINIVGAVGGERSGVSVSSAGDVNGDGFDDLVIGAHQGNALGNTRFESGNSYLLFGKADWSTTPTIDLAGLGTLGPTVGITLIGAGSLDNSGRTVSNAGDINGDGFDDLIIGAPGGDASGDVKFEAGESYLIFGKADWSTTPTIDLANLGTLGPTIGITIFGADSDDASGTSVSSAGDVNGDGFDDLVIGARSADASGNAKQNAGESYVVFGKADWSTTPTIDLAGLALAGITIVGADVNDQSGFSVSGAGDVNGDGFNDLIIGAPYADASGNSKYRAGESYVIFGGNGFTNSILSGNLGTNAQNVLLGDTTANIINGAGGDDLVSGGGGVDVLLGGQGNDTLVINDASFRRIVGGTGNDSLVLNNPSNLGFTLNLTTLRDNRLFDIEEIEMSGVNANNTLILNQREVLNLSSTSNTLIVRRNAGDIVNIGSGWTFVNTETIGPYSFHVYSQGQARLKVQAVSQASVAGRQVFYNNAAGFGTSGVNNAPTVNPINAIDPTKQALLPGIQTTTAANYTNYSRGLNGIVVDLTNPGNLSGISSSSFQFAIWNSFPDGTPNFVTINPTVTVSAFASGGTASSDRVKLVFADRAIENAWLRITVLADANTGLATNDVFYFGNARFDVTPASPFPSQQVVINIFDVNGIRSRQGQNPGIISNIFDVDRNGVVNVFDTNAVRAGQGVSSLRSFTAPLSLQIGLASSSSRSTATSVDALFADTSWLDVFQVGNSKNRQQRRS